VIAGPASGQNDPYHARRALAHTIADPAAKAMWHASIGAAFRAMGHIPTISELDQAGAMARLLLNRATSPEHPGLRPSPVVERAVHLAEEIRNQWEAARKRKYDALRGITRAQDFWSRSR